jgi:hypothetical protein
MLTYVLLPRENYSPSQHAYDVLVESELAPGQRFALYAAAGRTLFSPAELSLVSAIVKNKQPYATS